MTSRTDYNGNLSFACNGPWYDSSLTCDEVYRYDGDKRFPTADDIVLDAISAGWTIGGYNDDGDNWTRHVDRCPKH